MHLSIFWCDRKSSFCIVKFGENWETKQGPRWSTAPAATYASAVQIKKRLCSLAEEALASLIKSLKQLMFLRCGIKRHVKAEDFGQKLSTVAGPWQRTSCCLRWEAIGLNSFWPKAVFSSIEKCTMQKKISRHIKLAIHAWSTKCG
jgi:hypothetical protein